MKLFYLTSAKHGLLAMRNQRIKLSRFHDLNDPFELYAAALKNPRHRAKFRKFKDWVADRFGLVCFSTNWRNPVLWSHYGDKHRGVALELEVEKSEVCKVVYTPNRVFIDVEAAMTRGTFLATDAYRLATTKFKHWEYENERRIFVPLDKEPIEREKGHYFVPFNDRLRLTGIVVGAACSLSTKTIARNLPSEGQVTVTTARLAFTTFRIVRQRRASIELVTGVAQPALPADRQRRASLAVAVG